MAGERGTGPSEKLDPGQNWGDKKIKHAKMGKWRRKYNLHIMCRHIITAPVCQTGPSPCKKYDLMTSNQKGMIDADQYWLKENIYIYNQDAIDYILSINLFY